MSETRSSIRNESTFAGTWLDWEVGDGPPSELLPFENRHRVAEVAWGFSHNIIEARDGMHAQRLQLSKSGSKDATYDYPISLKDWQKGLHVQQDCT